MRSDDASGAARASIHAEFMAFLMDEGSAQAARDLARARGWPSSVVQRYLLEDVVEIIDGTHAPRIMVVDIDETEDPVSSMAALATRCGKECRIVGVGSTNDVILYRRLKEAGAHDYLVKPLEADLLRQVLAAAGKASATPEAGEVGSLTFVIGVRGGVGASTIAVNTAWLMAHEHERQTVLLDMDLQFGTDALALDLEPGRGLREALQSPDRVDRLLIASSLASESERFCVLGAEEPLEDPIQFDTRAAEALIRELRGTFANVVIDMPRALLPLHRRLLIGADRVILVSDLSLAGIRDTSRALAAVDALGGEAKVLPVVARVGKERQPQIDKAAFEKGIGRKLAALVPEDSKAVRQAANAGKALGAVAAAAAATRALRGLAQDIVGAAPPKKGPLSFLKRKKKAKG